MKAPYGDPVFVALCTGYGLLSGVRKTFSVSLPLIMIDLNLSKSDVGIIASNFALAYGLSKFIGSVISDYVSCKNLFTIAILLTSLFTILFGLGSDLYTLCGLWFLNGCVQGLGWPALAAIVFEQYDKSTRGTVWSAATASGNMGYVLGPFVFNALLVFGWRSPFLVSGCVGLCIAVMVHILIPEKSLLSKSNISSPDTDKVPLRDVTVTSGSDQRNKTWLDGIAEWSWLASLTLWSLLVSSGFTMFLLRAVSDWSALYFQETLTWDSTSSTFYTFWNEVGGMIGSVSAGVASDTFFKQRRDITSCAYAAITIPGIVGVALCTHTLVGKSRIDDAMPGSESFSMSHVLLAVCMFCIGMGINGPKTLVGMCVREGVPVRRVGLIGGILGIVGQLGSATAGGLLGWILEKQGWEAYVPMLVGAAVVCVILLLAYTLFHPPHRKDEHMD